MDHLEVGGQRPAARSGAATLCRHAHDIGTGAEVTRNAVVGVPEHKRKVSLRDARMLPVLAIVDPALTDQAGRSVTLDSGLDAITQLIEPYVSSRANPMTDALCRAALPPALAALRVLMERVDAEARDKMAWAASAEAWPCPIAGLGVIHGLPARSGAWRLAPHGAICGVLPAPRPSAPTSRRLPMAHEGAV